MLSAQVGGMTSLSLPRSLSWLALLASMASLGAAGCAVPVDAEEEDIDRIDESVTSSWKCDVSSIQTSKCQAVIANVQEQAKAVGRGFIVDRGIWWMASGITYDRNKYKDGYRRDCSGFVSMCWEFEQNPSTAYFPPFVSGKYAVELPSIDDLAPGDALNKTYRNPYGHVMLFAGWASPDHQQLYLLHHYSTGKPVALIQVSRSSLGDYIPIRSVEAPPVSSSGPSTSTPTTPAPAPTTPPSGCGVMSPGSAIGENQAVVSCDGRFTFVQQGDGNLVLYMAGKGALWASGTNGKPGRTTVMQEDGNLVMYTADGKPVWYTGTHGHAGAWLNVQNDGNVVIYQGEKALWSTKTSGY
jgi:hypothetical protein